MKKATLNKNKTGRNVKTAVVAASLGFAVCIAGAAPVYTVTLPNGATNTLSEAFSLGFVSSSEGMASRAGLATAEDLRITGGGRLEINDDLKGEGFKGEIHVLAGAMLRLTANGALGDTDHGTFVADGATLETECLDSSDNNKLDFAGERLTFAGTGVGGVGALVARTPVKQERNGVWGGTYLTMTGDATISTVTGYQSFPTDSPDNSLDMNGYTLTVRGFDTEDGGMPTSVPLRPIVKNPGHIVITNCGVTINDKVLLPGGEEHALTLTKGSTIELFDNTKLGLKEWTLRVLNSSSRIKTSSNGGIWDGPIVAEQDLNLTLASQKKEESILTNMTRLVGKMTVNGKVSVLNSSSDWAAPSLTLASPENDFMGGIFEVGTNIRLRIPVDGALSCATTIVNNASSVELGSDLACEQLPIARFTGGGMVSGGLTGIWAGVVKEGVGELVWNSGLGFCTLDLNAGRLSLEQALPDVVFYAGLSYSFDSNFTGWSKGDRPASSAYYGDLSIQTNKFVLDFSDILSAEPEKKTFKNGSASYWAGYIMNSEPTNVTWRFATCIRYLALLRINGANIIKKQNTKEVAFGNATLLPGANSFVIHSASDSDCFTYPPTNCSSWTNGYAVAVCKTSSTSQDSVDFEPLADPGDGSVLRCALEGTPLWAELGESWSNEFSAVKRLTGTAEATLDMGNRWLRVERLEGVPTVQGRTDCTSRFPALTVTDVWSVSGADLAEGQGLVCGPQLVFCDGVKLEIVGGKALRKSGKVTVAESDNPIVGMPEVVSTDDSEFKISKSTDGRKIFLEYVPKGLLMIVR